MANRNEVLKERYDLLRVSGLSSDEANKYKHYKWSTVTKISSEVGKLGIYELEQKKRLILESIEKEVLK